MPRRARWRWRRFRERHAERCGYCGWYPPDPLLGQVFGRHDPRFVGHGRWCPSKLYASLRTAQGVADQWRALSAWARLAAFLDVPGADDTWRHMAWALMQRADQLGVPFPVCDDASELVTGGG